jgi:hypothetical protein
MVRIASIASFSGAAALALAVPAAARTVDSWDVVPTGQNCTMISTFEGDVSIGLLWSPKSGELGFMTTVPHVDRAGPQPTEHVELTFDGSGPYTQWEDQRAAVVTGDYSDAVIANWGAAHSDELARAVAAASHVKVRLGGKDMGTYDLAGSPAAYRALTQCGRQLAAK